MGVLNDNLRPRAAVVSDNTRRVDGVDGLSDVCGQACANVDTPEASLSAESEGAADSVLAHIGNKELNENMFHCVRFGFKFLFVIFCFFLLFVQCQAV